MPAGRPTTYSEELTAKICRDDDMPSMASIFLWLGKYPEFSESYTRAREAQAETHADRIVEIADDETLDPNHKRIMVDARKWVAAKLKPKRYGDKLDLEHKGEVGLTVNVLRITDANDKPAS